MTLNSDTVQFDKGIMRLSAYDPLSKQYETRILTLPELPSLEPLDHLFNNKTTDIKQLRLTKSCNHKRATNIVQKYAESNPPRRCQSNPNISNKSSYSNTSNRISNGGPIRSKRSISSAFQAFTEFIQKANKKIRSSHHHHHQKRQAPQQNEWSTETWLDEIRLSSDSSISTLNLNCPSNSNRQTIVLSKACENWWSMSPPIRSF